MCRGKNYFVLNTGIVNSIGTIDGNPALKHNLRGFWPVSASSKSPTTRSPFTRTPKSSSGSFFTIRNYEQVPRDYPAHRGVALGLIILGISLLPWSLEFPGPRQLPGARTLTTRSYHTRSTTHRCRIQRSRVRRQTRCFSAQASQWRSRWPPGKQKPAKNALKITRVFAARNADWKFRSVSLLLREMKSATR